MGKDQSLVGFVLFCEIFSDRMTGFAGYFSSCSSCSSCPVVSAKTGPHFQTASACGELVSLRRRLLSSAASGVCREWLWKFLARGDLAGLQKGFDEFAIAANGHAGKFLEPGTVRHFGFGAEPIRHQPKLIGGNVAAADAVKQMIKEVWRKIVSPNLRHGYSP
jgi:hypothetical protein